MPPRLSSTAPSLSGCHSTASSSVQWRATDGDGTWDATPLLVQARRADRARAAELPGERGEPCIESRSAAASTSPPGAAAAAATKRSWRNPAPRADRAKELAAPHGSRKRICQFGSCESTHFEASGHGDRLEDLSRMPTKDSGTMSRIHEWRCKILL